MAFLGSDVLFLSGCITIVVVVYWSQLLTAARQLLLLISCLAIMFLNTLTAEYIHSYWSLNSCGSGFTFFVLTGLHGSHVTVGVVCFLFVFIGITSASFLYSYTSSLCSGTLGLFLYWHLVDSVWLGLVFLLYGGGPLCLAA